VRAANAPTVVLRKLARARGGEAFIPAETADVVPIFRRIAEDIRQQYTIGHVPSHPNLDNTYRTIKVKASEAHRGSLVMRARSGYVASPERKAQPAGSSLERAGGGGGRDC
jgi:VWFA-related protein